MVERWQRALQVAAGDAPADLVLSGGRVVNVFTGEIEHGNVAILDGKIVGIGDYELGDESVDLDGAYVAPSFIDGHFHTESSLLWVTQLARAVVPHGTGAIVTDPHEIVNVAGMPGFHALVAASRGLPMDVYFTVPSCVPASSRETSGAIIRAADIAEGLRDEAAVGLGEMMNFPGVLAGDPEIYERLQAAAGRRKDGHAPGVVGRALDGYVLSGMTSDHESTEYAEGLDKLRRGLMLMIREGSTEHNLVELLPLVNDHTWTRCCFASDDRDCMTLLHDGHMNQTLRLAVANGLDPVRALTMATFNTANYWGLAGHGALAPGYWANLVVLEDLRDFNVQQTWWQGQLVAELGKATFETSIEIPPELRNTVHIHELTLHDLRLDPADAHQAVGTIDGQIVTQWRAVEPTIVDGAAVADVQRDLLKLVCVERHAATGNVGVGYVQGFGLQRGAIASSISHDAHNITAVGTNDADLLVAIERIVALQGGLVVVDGGRVIAELALPVAGILSDQPLEPVAEGYEHMEDAAHALGSKLHSPFGLLAFMALSVIPEARVTDQGFIRL